MDGAGKIIDSFDGEYAFLSNFYSSKIVEGGLYYPTVEHAYQAAKTHNIHQRITISHCFTPGAAKRAGRRVNMRADWEAVKEDVMLRLLRLKFRDEALRKLLIDTGTATLVEGNTWGDRYWGVSGGRGKNRLGVLLMQVRDELGGRNENRNP